MATKVDKILANKAPLDARAQRVLVRQGQLRINRAGRIRKLVQDGIYPTALASAQALQKAHEDEAKYREICAHLEKYGTRVRPPGPRLTRIAREVEAIDEMLHPPKGA